MREEPKQSEADRLDWEYNQSRRRDNEKVRQTQCECGCRLQKHKGKMFCPDCNPPEER
jgi:hypothetical protein